MGFIGFAVDEIGADEIGDLLLQLLGNEDTPAELFAARIGKREVGLCRGLAIPHRKHAEAVGEVFHRHLGAQLVEAKLGGQRLRQRSRHVDQEAAAMAGGRFGDQKVHNDLALRGQQRAKAADPGADQLDLSRDEAIEEIAGVLAADLDHAPIGKKRCFHAEKCSFQVPLGNACGRYPLRS